MNELQKRAKEYLTSKGVKSTGDKFIALEVMDLLCEFTQREQLNIGGVSNSLLEIELKSWEHTCGDGCCYTDGLDIFLNGEQLDEQNAEDSVNALTVVLTKLGYKFEINCY